MTILCFLRVDPLTRSTLCATKKCIAKCSRCCENGHFMWILDVFWDSSSKKPGFYACCTVRTFDFFETIFNSMSLYTLMSLVRSFFLVARFSSCHSLNVISFMLESIYKLFGRSVKMSDICIHTGQARQASQGG